MILIVILAKESVFFFCATQKSTQIRKAGTNFYYCLINSYEAKLNVDETIVICMFVLIFRFENAIVILMYILMNKCKNKILCSCNEIENRFFLFSSIAK